MADAAYWRKVLEGYYSTLPANERKWTPIQTGTYDAIVVLFRNCIADTNAKWNGGFLAKSPLREMDLQSHQPIIVWQREAD